MNLVFGRKTSNIEELIAQCISAEHAAVQKTLGKSYCGFLGVVGLDGNNRAVQILDPYLDVSVQNTCRMEWCRMFEKHSELNQIDQIPLVAYYLGEEDFTATRVCSDPELALIPQTSFRPYKRKINLNELIPSASIEKLLLETNLSSEEKQYADACRCIVTAQKFGKAWRPPGIPSQNREVALMNDLLSSSQNIEPKIGDRIKVFWPGDRQFYHGTVDDIRALTTTFHHIVYDDSDQEWLPLSERLFERDDCTIRKKAPRSEMMSGGLACSEQQHSPRTKRSSTTLGKDRYIDDKVLGKAPRSSYDHKNVNRKLAGDTTNRDKSKSMVLPAPQCAGRARKNTNSIPDANRNELIEQLLELIDCQPPAVPVPEVERLMDILMSVECDSIDDLRQRMRLGTKLRQIPELDARRKQLVDKALNSTRLLLIDHWKAALQAKNTEDLEKAATNFWKILDKPLSSTFIEKHGLKKLLQDSKVLFAYYGLDFPQSLETIVP